MGPKFLTTHDSSSETSTGSSDSSSSSDSDFSSDECFMCPKCFRKFTLEIARDSHVECCGVRLPTKADSQSGTAKATAHKDTKPEAASNHSGEASGSGAKSDPVERIVVQTPGPWPANLPPFQVICSEILENIKPTDLTNLKLILLWLARIGQSWLTLETEH